jgi:hypothetical protein
VIKIADFDGNARIIFLFFLLIFLLTRWRENRLTDFYAAAGRSDKKSEACQVFLLIIFARMFGDNLAP